ncbi:hypothetical protein [Pseudotabrizicola sp.]|uniref:hypothetical protein n=1 Tax=Pseudotabrizicola sp. TaxID=2939647 RepID=UPI002728C8AA|nr:hypothetical protein [Pseudotabrizicola sp.]MDO8885051.1 hypothetical protein [Pseudotabrizicola sp.]
MQMIPRLQDDSTQKSSWAVVALVISDGAGSSLLCRRLAGLGAQVDMQPEFGDAVARLLAGTHPAGLLVIDCDHAGGHGVGQSVFERLTCANVWLPVILMSSDCVEQTFPVGHEAPFQLRSPVSAVALRIAFDLALSPDRRHFSMEKDAPRKMRPYC